MKFINTYRCINQYFSSNKTWKYWYNEEYEEIQSLHVTIRHVRLDAESYLDFVIRLTGGFVD